MIGTQEVPARVRSRRRAELALRLHGERLTFEQIAAFPGEDGRPLYRGRSAAYEAVQSAMRRRRTLAGRARLGAQLVAAGLTYEQVAAYPAGDGGTTLYGSARSAQQSVTIERERRRLVLAGRVPASTEDLVSLAAEQLDERAAARP